MILNYETIETGSLASESLDDISRAEAVQYVGKLTASAGAQMWLIREDGAQLQLVAAGGHFSLDLTRPDGRYVFACEPDTTGEIVHVAAGFDVIELPRSGLVCHERACTAVEEFFGGVSELSGTWREPD